MSTVTTGERIRRLRTARGWTQADLATAAGISTQARISRIENSQEMDPYRISRIAGALDTTVEHLLTGEGGPRVDTPAAIPAAIPAAGPIADLAALLGIPAEHAASAGCAIALRWLKETP